MKELEIITLPVGLMNTNCYLLRSVKTNNCLIIDPGDDADYIGKIITEKKCSPKKIIATHGHFDHIMAVSDLQLAFDIPFLINKKDEFLVKSMRSSAKHFLGIEAALAPKIDIYLKESDCFLLDGYNFSVIETPGHTPGSICLYCKNKNILFVGDLIFANGGVGRTDFSYSNPQLLRASLKKIFKFSDQTKVYPGHGDAFFLSFEKHFHKYEE